MQKFYIVFLAVLFGCNASSPSLKPLPETVLKTQTITKGKALLEAKKYRKAQKIFETILHQDPSNFEAMEGLSFALRESGQFEVSEQWWRKAQTLRGLFRPFLQTMRQNLDLAFQKDWFMQAKDWSQNQNAVYLLDLNLLEMGADGQASEYYHGAAMTLTLAGRNELGELQIPGDARLLWAFVHQPGGTLWLPERIQSDGSVQVISLYGLTDGSVFDYAWWRPLGSWKNLDTEFVFGANHPLLHSRICIGNAGSKLETSLQQGEKLQKKTSLLEGQTIDCWQRENIHASGSPEMQLPSLRIRAIVSQD